MDGKFETYLERKSSGNYFDTKLTVKAYCNGNSTYKRNHTYKTALSYRVVLHANINVSVKGQVFFQTSHGDYFVFEFNICMKYMENTSKFTLNKNGLVKKNVILLFMFC